MSSSFVETRLKWLSEKGFLPTTILDIGAHRGSWAEMAHEIWPSAHFFMVDANEECRPHLENLTHLGGYEIALLGKEEQQSVTYFASTKVYNTGNSLYKENTSYFDNCEERHLSMTTLDALVQKHHLKNIDLIKIDTQGSELDILSGGLKTLSHAQVVIAETQIVSYNQGAPKIGDVIAFMRNLGWEFFDTIEISYLPTGELMQMDLVFVPQNSHLQPKGRLF